MGRDRRNETKSSHFARLDRNLLEQPAWRALSPTAQALYPWLRLEWRGPQANNNGHISLSVRQASDRLGIGKDAAARAFRDLQARGFLVARHVASLGLGGQAHGTLYELTEIAMPNSDSNQGRRLFKDWREGADYPVIAAPTHNPRGRNSKTKPCPENRDAQVIKIGTRR